MNLEVHPAVVRKLITSFGERRPMRTTSLIVSFFGDVVSQHGQVIWLGSLVEALGALGVNQRLVRTSVFRLVKDGWLEFERQGRCSYYRFSPFGLHEYERAARRIYALEQKSWQGRWQVLIPLKVPEESRQGLRRSLLWQGFRAVSTDTYIRPGESDNALLETLEEFGATSQVMLMEASAADETSLRMVKAMVEEHWMLREVALAYREFITHFRPLLKFLDSGNHPDPLSAFIARTLLIHDYRRVLLRDTPLPDELLPPGWPGAEAKLMTSRIYHALAEPSAEYIRSRLQGEDGSLPGPEAGFYQRFSESG